MIFANGMEYVDKKDILKIIKSVNQSSTPGKDMIAIHNDYKYGQLSVKNFNNRKYDFKISLYVNAILKQNLDEELITALNTLKVNSEKSALDYYNFGDSRSFNLVNALAIIFNDAGKLKIDNRNIHFIQEKLNDKQFYLSHHDVNDNPVYLFKESRDKKYSSEDYDSPDLALYGIRNTNENVLNYLYQDIISNKDKYIKLVAGKVKFASFKSMLEHFNQRNIDWPNKENIKISSIDNIFTNNNMLLYIAKNNNISGAQTDILNYLFENDKKFINKIMASAGNRGIYSKTAEKQKESKDVFLVALHNKNYGLIDVLLKNGYKLNEEENKLVVLHQLDQKVDSIEKKELSNITMLNDTINNLILNGNLESAIRFTENLKEQDLKDLTDFYKGFDYNSLLLNYMNDNSSTELTNKLISMSNKKVMPPLDALIILNAEIIAILEKKNFNAYGKEPAKMGLKRIVNNDHRSKTIDDNDKNLILKAVYSKLNDLENMLYTHEFLQVNDLELSKKIVSFSENINNLIKEGVIKIIEEHRPLYATKIFDMYLDYSPIERKKVFGSEKDNIDDSYLNKLVSGISSFSEDNNEILVKNIISLIKEDQELQKKAISKLNKNSWKDMSEVVSVIERELLFTNTNIVNNKKTLTSRL